MEENDAKMKMKQIVINAIEKKEEIIDMIETTLDGLKKMIYSDNEERIQSLCNTYVMESKRATELGVNVTSYDNKYNGLREIILHQELVN